MWRDGCPNDCFEENKQGVCSSISSSTSSRSRSSSNGDAEVKYCICNQGWGGADCSLPIAGNPCSLHGSIKPDDEALGLDYVCVCDAGWTGTDCSTPNFVPQGNQKNKPTTNNLPWGEIFDDDNVMSYSSNDKYGDDSPLFNMSSISTIRLSVNTTDFINLLSPENLYNGTYMKISSFLFHNENFQTKLSDVGIKIRGASSRMDQKKGFTIKFNHYISGQSLLQQKKISLRPGSVADDTLIKFHLYTDFQRSVGVPVSRAAYALLYINDIFYGVYTMNEDYGSSDFIKSRIEDDDGSGNMMQLNYDVYLQYFGSDPTYYQNMTHSNTLGAVLYNYDQCSGNGNWSDFIIFLEFVNLASDEDFANKIEQVLQVPTLLRQMVVESFMLASDSFGPSGQNYYIYYRQSSTQTKHAPTSLTSTISTSSSSSTSLAKRNELYNQMQIIEVDFDEVFSFDVQADGTRTPTMNPDIFDFFLKLDDPSNNNPLLHRLFSIDKYRQQYISYYKTFSEKIFSSSSSFITSSSSSSSQSQSSIQPSQRYMQRFECILPWIARDKMWQLSYGMSMNMLTLYAQQTSDMLYWRCKDIYINQIPLYTSMR